MPASDWKLQGLGQAACQLFCAFAMSMLREQLCPRWHVCMAVLHMSMRRHLLTDLELLRQPGRETCQLQHKELNRVSALNGSRSEPSTPNCWAAGCWRLAWKCGACTAT